MIFLKITLTEISETLKSFMQRYLSYSDECFSRILRKLDDDDDDNDDDNDDNDE